MKTLRRSHNKKHNKTRSSNKKSANKFEQEIVLQFLHMLNTVKLYHWKTHSYPNHKATDELYGTLGDNIDKFIEVLLGKLGNRVDLTHVKSIPLCDLSSLEQFKREIGKYKSYLVGLDSNKTMNSMSNSDLFNIRDEILGDLNQYLYLSTLH